MMHLSVLLQICVVPLAGTWIETCLDVRTVHSEKVVPLAGTWIETAVTFNCSPLRPSSFPSRERGLKPHNYLSVPGCRMVVPLAGTWIETSSSNSSILSFCVVPLAGTWIETKLSYGTTANVCMRRSPRGNVD